MPSAFWARVPRGTVNTGHKSRLAVLFLSPSRFGKRGAGDKTKHLPGTGDVQLSKPTTPFYVQLEED